MENIQGFAKSHWTPPLGDYSLCIALMAAWVPFKTMRMKENTSFAGHSNGHGNVPVLKLCALPNGGGPGLQKPPDATIWQVSDLISSIGH
jgi:hypothetical protein